ncbi:sugar phosphate isomerase/epimerase [Rhodocytophaga rosea]|uniref:Sugar phosphate isomerase/epimerase n=1 Tax=Rhodocytophaga rosea TaxID=2704465 RepID=A0A6C0GBW9_9BACT|nr:sugar phosphate isomerase/epimerase family protein [Rhodocytophaga rosea]QHT65445.1 sugar phosphate isomerase/epimerase [Rhodocytophaga rosea]
MKTLLIACLCAVLAFTACNNEKNTTQDTASADSSSTPAATQNVANDWKFGVALWTFHTFNFPDALAKVDSADLTYIEPNTFHKTGPELKDSLILQLSPSGIAKLRTMIDQKGLKAESVYIVGDSTVLSWKKQFEIAKQLGAKFVTAEPPTKMWDSVDSLAGAYGMKVAIHEHWKGTSQYWHPDSVLAAIKDHPNFGACADLGHWPKSGINPVDAVKKLSGHIIGVHLKDIAAFNNPKLVDVPVGTGVVDFPAVFDELKKQNFNGHIYIERDAEDLPSNLPSVIQTVKYYNDQVNRLQ